MDLALVLLCLAEIIELFIAVYSLSLSANLTIQETSKQLVCIISMRRLWLKRTLVV